MKKNEVLELLSKRGLLKVIRYGRVIEYIDGDKVFYDNLFHNKENVFGVFYDKEFKKYVFFITGEDLGGIIETSKKYNTEDDAFTGMYERIDLISRSQL